MKKRVRRCQECNSILTGLDIVIVEDDFRPLECNARLFEAIYCERCGHQNIIGRYYRHAPDDIRLTAQIAREDTKKHELTCNEMRKAMDLKPIQSEADYEQIRKGKTNHQREL